MGDMTASIFDPRPRIAIPAIQWDHSEQIDQLIGALAVAQGDIQNAGKDEENADAERKYRYATLAACWAACRTPLSANGLAVVQLPKANKAEVTVVSILGHKSGQWLACSLAMTAYSRDSGGDVLVENPTPQGIGSAITYAKRYLLCAMVGIATADDDDGRAASGQVQGSRVQRSAPAVATTTKWDITKEPAAMSYFAAAKKELDKLSPGLYASILQQFSVKSPEGFTDREEAQECHKRLGEHINDLQARAAAKNEQSAPAENLEAEPTPAPALPVMDDTEEVAVEAKVEEAKPKAKLHERTAGLAVQCNVDKATLNTFILAAVGAPDVKSSEPKKVEIVVEALEMLLGSMGGKSLGELISGRPNKETGETFSAMWVGMMSRYKLKDPLVKPSVVGKCIISAKIQAYKAEQVGGYPGGNFTMAITDPGDISRAIPTFSLRMRFDAEAGVMGPKKVPVYIWFLKKFGHPEDLLDGNPPKFSKQLMTTLSGKMLVDIGQGTQGEYQVLAHAYDRTGGTELEERMDREVKKG